MRKALWIWLVWGMVCGSSYGVPSGQRSFPVASGVPGGLLQVSVRVELGGDVPDAIILAENWPEGCRVVSGVWEGVEFTPVQAGREWRWLWGYGSGNPGVSSGVLRYEVELPAGESPEVVAAQVFGTLCTCEGETLVAGDDTLLVDEDGESTMECVLTLHPGWNLLSLPMDPDEYSRAQLSEVQSLCLVPSGLPSHYQICPLAELSGGEVFWLYSEEAQSRALLLTGGTPDSSVAVSGGGWSSGWNLVGVVGESALPAPPSGKPVWHWEDGCYREWHGALLPGVGYWVFH